MRFPFIAAVTAVLLTIVVVAACNKDNIKTTTRVKCVTCANGGQCINDTCRCPSGWEGTACQTQTRVKYTGSWTVFEKGSMSTSSHNYSINIEALSSSAITQVYINYLYQYSFANFYEVLAYVASDSINIPLQYFGSQSIVGKGVLQSSNSSFGSLIRMRYLVKDTLTGAFEDFGYTSAVDSPSVWTR